MIKTLNQIAPLINLYPYNSNLQLKHIVNDAVVVEVPKWYTYLFNENNCTIIAVKKYGDIVVNIDIDNYNTDYQTFLQYVNETMYRYYDLFKPELNPYDNVTENTTTINQYGEKVIDYDKSKRSSKTIYGEKSNENNYGTTTQTDTSSTVPNNTTDFKDREKVISNTNSHVDIFTTNKGGSVDNTETSGYKDTDIHKQYTDTITVNRNGNIGTTTNATLGKEHIDFSKKLKLYDLFLNEWLDFFGCGYWL